MKRILSSILLVALALTMVSCASEKGAATSAIKAAETAWAAAKDNVMKILPADGQLVEDAIAAAKASLEQGDAKAALAAVKDIPAKITELTASLGAKETELKGVWELLNTNLPGVVQTVQKRVDILSKARSLPAGLDQAAFDQVKTDMTTATSTWVEAQAAQQAGNLGEAVAKAIDVKGLVVKALTALKMPVPPALQ
jgi:lipopolysaccharide export LptBFGC system permease protein LptF